MLVPSEHVNTEGNSFVTNLQITDSPSGKYQEINWYDWNVSKAACYFPVQYWFSIRQEAMGESSSYISRCIY